MKTLLAAATIALFAFLPAVSGNGAATAAATLHAEQGPQPVAQTANVERLDTALAEIVPADAQIESVASGFTWTEGPVWVHGGTLLFAEITSNSIRRYDPGTGLVSIFMQPTGYKGTTPYGGPEPGTNGMTLDPTGRLTVAGHAGRTVWRLDSMDPKSGITILADAYQGKTLNSPNDLVYRSDGSLYFTDPPYGLPTQGDKDPAKKLTVNGVYRVPAAASQAPGSEPSREKLQLLVSDLPRPNGIVFSPDEKYLYVNNTEPKKIWMRYPVLKDGTLGKGEIFFDATGNKRSGSPDGMKVDQRGNVYSTGPGGIWIFSPAGKHLGTILLPVKASNVSWGGDDARTLYITDSDKLLRIRLNIPGVRP